MRQKFWRLVIERKVCETIEVVRASHIAVGVFGVGIVAAGESGECKP